MISFILNNTTIRTPLSSGMTVLDFIRYHQQLKGTKIGCREGDCGACAVLVGTLLPEGVQYRSMTSCLMPLANAQGKHIVTIEGINPPAGILTPVQQAIVEENGSQCGFCTVGFIVALTGYCLENTAPSDARAISAMDGNICRCTGYKSIERAAQKITQLLSSHNGVPAISLAIEKGIVPAWFAAIRARLEELSQDSSVRLETSSSHSFALPVGGGTDLYVQRGEELPHLKETNSLFDDPSLKGIREVDGEIEIGGAVTITDMLESPVMHQYFPHLDKHLKLISSTPIRNMSTLAGNLVNASPIGDLTIWFLALNATVEVEHQEVRNIALKDFFLAYKKLAKTDQEIVKKIRFPAPSPNHYFNFEKVSKRTCLDIASVNTAIQLWIEDHRVVEAHVSAGGVAPIPLYLKNTSAFLAGKEIPSADTDFSAIHQMIQSDIRPISDVRGSATYKLLLLQQLIRAHFIELFAAV